MALVPTQNSQTFIAAPVGRCIVGPTYAIWCAAPDLVGSIIWGALEAQSIREMIAIGGFVKHPSLAARRFALTDCRGIESADMELILGFVASARERAPEWSLGLERQAMLVPAGFHGVVISGALPMTGTAHRLRVEHELEAALAFLDHPAARSAHAAAMTIAAELRGRSVLLARLRAQLGRALDSATIESCASALGMSTRTLQRSLRALDTSFSDELRRARIAAAESLLVHTGLKIDAIASRVGFGTASRLSAWLRRERNVTASELRAERRSRSLHEPAREGRAQQDSNLQPTE